MSEHSLDCRRSDPLAIRRSILVHRKFHPLSPNELWATDTTEHLTGEGKT